MNTLTNFPKTGLELYNTFEWVKEVMDLLNISNKRFVLSQPEVIVQPFGKGVRCRGAYNRSKNIIRIKSTRSDKEKLSTLVHEITHHYQEVIESNESYFKKPHEIEARMVAAFQINSNKWWYKLAKRYNTDETICRTLATKFIWLT